MITMLTVTGRLLPITDADTVRFWRKVDKSDGPDGCWLWTVSLDHCGYGRFGLSGRSVLAHRFAYMLARNDLDPALQLDHLCHTPACVNPAHLRQVTNAENLANRAGATAGNLSSGVRGVSRFKRDGRWRAYAKLNGLQHFAGLHDSIESAELAALQLRLSLGMANAADLARLTELGSVRA